MVIQEDLDNLDGVVVEWINYVLKTYLDPSQYGKLFSSIHETTISIVGFLIGIIYLFFVLHHLHLAWFDDHPLVLE